MTGTDDFAARAGAILDLLKQGIPTQDLDLHLADAHTLALQRQCALLRRTDLAGLDLALAPLGAAGAAELPALLARGDLTQPVPGRDLYLIPRALRETHLPRWDPEGADAGSFRALHLALAEHFAALGPAWVPEHLHHRLAADPPAGLTLMDALLAERLPQPAAAGAGAAWACAEGAVDGLAVARALDLLDLVAEQLRFVPPALKDRYDRARGLTESWSWWSDDWFRTRRYVERPRVQAVLIDPALRLIEMTAAGGSGKTMLLRWLITHHCLPRGRPVAHLDFDHFIDRPRAPWQLLLHCAEQLDRQFAKAPFYSLIRRGCDLEHATADATAGFVASLPHIFAGILNSQNQGPVTLVVDTFEEAMLADPAMAVDLVALLLGVAHGCEHLRLILCGRYPLSHLGLERDLEAADPVAYALFQTRVQRLRLPLFERDEAAAYLGRRGLVLDEAGLDRVLGVTTGIGAAVVAPAAGSDETSPAPPSGVSRAEVSPFHLALVADLLEDRQRRGESPAGLLADLDQVPVIYLIERIILRIEDVGVRWLLRYGVVPRRLTRPFFEQVILPYLRRVHRRGRPPDGPDPVESRLPAGLAERSIFFSDSEVFRDGEASSWGRLLQFAGPDSWVSHDEDGLIFHVCVREPMLALLAQDPVLAAIHRDAADWFEAAADRAATGALRAACEREAVYHGRRAQPESPVLTIAGTLARLHRHLKAEDFLSAFTIAAETGREYGELLGVNRLIAAVTEFLLALDLADTDATAAGRDRWLATAGRVLTRLGDLLPQTAGEVLAWLSALLQVRRPPLDLGVLREAFERLRAGIPGSWSEALSGTGPGTAPGTGLGASLSGVLDWVRHTLAFTGLEPLLRPRLVRSLAIVRERLGDPRCVSDLAGLLDERLGEAPGPGAPCPPLTALLVESLARTLDCFGDPGPAFTTLARALEAGGHRPPAANQAVLGLLQGLARPQAAGAFAGTPGVDLPGVSRDLARIGAGLRDDPSAAYAALAALRGPSAAVHPAPAESARQRLAAHRAAALMGDLHRALGPLSEAAALFREAGETGAATECLRHEAEFWLWHHGNLTRAAEALAGYERAIATLGGDADGPIRVGLCGLAMCQGTPWRGAQGPGDLDLGQAIEGLAGLTCVCERAGAAVGLLALLPARGAADPVGRIAAVLAAALERRPDALARACYPWRLRERRTPIPLAPTMAERLAGLIDLSAPPPPLLGLSGGAGDLAWARLGHAHLLRLIGQRDLARTLADLAAAWFEASGSLAGLREVWHLRALAGWDRPLAAVMAPFNKAPSALRDTVAIEQAEHSLRVGALTRARDWLAGVDLAGLAQWPSHFHPRALLVAARLDGDDTETRLGRLREAEAAFAALGNPRGAGRCRHAIVRLERRMQQGAALDLPGGKGGDAAGAARGSPLAGTLPVADPAEPWTAAPGWTLRLGRTADRLTLGELGVETPGPPLPVAIGKTLASTKAEIAALTALMQGDAEAAPPALVAGLAGAPGRFVGEVAAGLIAPIADWPRPQGRLLDLAIEAERLCAAALPWELTRLDPETWPAGHLDLLYRRHPKARAGERQGLRWLQAGLRATQDPGLVLDGIMGPRTRRALDAALAESGGDRERVLARLREALAAGWTGGPPPLAVIIQAARAQQARSRRGIDHARSGLPDLYRRQGFDLRLVEGRDLDGWLAEHGAARPPSIVHIYATWIEERSAGYLGPDLGEGIVRHGPMRGDHPARGAPGSPQIPLLILDGPGEPDPTEQVRQLLIRNAAASLFAGRADCPNVLALGLDASPDLEALGAVLAAVRSGESLRAIYHAVAGNPPGFAWPQLGAALAMLTGRLAPALWTGNPDLSVLRPDGPEQF